ncbi:MAG TPA: thioredoxin [Planctomycetota bacterium]|nr:thioredoxin [Planctomycetota bacterium]
MAKAVLKVNDDNFASEVEKSKDVVLVDMGAEWCPPCKMLAPIIEEVAEAVAGRATVAALDVDESRKTASRFNVLNVPTLIFFKDGKEVERLVGVSPKEKIVGVIDKLVG